MSVHAGTILHVAGNNVIDRIQSAGLGNVTVPIDTVREVGNRLVVDKVPTEPSFTFTVTSLDVSTELEAMIAGKVGASQASATAPGASDPDGTVYEWGLCEFVNVMSPWKDATSGSAGTVEAGHLIPGYYPTRISYSFGVTEAAQETLELSGGSFYYAAGTPVEQFETGDGSTDAFATDETAIPHRIGGAEGTTFKSIFGVIVDGVLQTEGVDYTQSPSNTASPGTATVTFTDPPANGARIRFSYFSTAAHAYPDASHASVVVKPGEVRGRHICIYVGGHGSLSLPTRSKVGGVQRFELEATVDGDFEREMCNEEIVGYTINGTDTNGTITIRSKDAAAFLDFLSKVTGVDDDEVIGWLNVNSVPLEVQILNPKNPGSVIKTLYVEDAIFQTPGTPAQVNTPTDFAITFQSRNGTYKAIKGAMS